MLIFLKHEDYGLAVRAKRESSPKEAAIMKVIVSAQSEPIEIDVTRTAIVVVDMQNAFCSGGGMLDLLGRLDVGAIHR